MVINPEGKTPAPLLVKGLFYPEEETEREELIIQWECDKIPVDNRIKALILPHGAWPLCGDIIAKAMATQKDRSFGKIVMLATVHGNSSNAIYLPAFDYYSINPHQVPVDKDSIRELICKESVLINPIPFEEENSFESIIPFVGRFLPGNKVLPLLCGSNSPETGQLLSQILPGIINPEDDLLIIISNLTGMGNRDIASKQTDTLLLQLGNGLYSELQKSAVLGDISPCGLVPLSIGLSFISKNSSFLNLLEHKEIFTNLQGMIKYIHYGSILIKG